MNGRLFDLSHCIRLNGDNRWDVSSVIEADDGFYLERVGSDVEASDLLETFKKHAEWLLNQWTTRARHSE